MQHATSQSSFSDGDLLARVRSDPSAIGELYRRHALAVLALLGRRHSPEVAADLTAETFCAVLLSAHRYDASRGSGVGWIFGVAAKKSADYWRSQAVDRRAMTKLKLDPPDFGTDELTRIEERLSAAPAYAALSRSMEALTADERALLEALIVEELSASEYAARIGSRPATIRKRLQRTLASLRTTMQETP